MQFSVVAQEIMTAARLQERLLGLEPSGQGLLSKRGSMQLDPSLTMPLTRGLSRLQSQPVDLASFQPSIGNGPSATSQQQAAQPKPAPLARFFARTESQPQSHPIDMHKAQVREHSRLETTSASAASPAASTASATVFESSEEHQPPHEELQGAVLPGTTPQPDQLATEAADVAPSSMIDIGHLVRRSSNAGASAVKRPDDGSNAGLPAASTDNLPSGAPVVPSVLDLQGDLSVQIPDQSRQQSSASPPGVSAPDELQGAIAELDVHEPAVAQQLQSQPAPGDNSLEQLPRAGQDTTASGSTPAAQQGLNAPSQTAQQADAEAIVQPAAVTAAGKVVAQRMSKISSRSDDFSHKRPDDVAPDSTALQPVNQPTTIPARIGSPDDSKAAAIPGAAHEAASAVKESPAIADVPDASTASAPSAMKAIGDLHPAKLPPSKAAAAPNKRQPRSPSPVKPSMLLGASADLSATYPPGSSPMEAAKPRTSMSRRSADDPVLVKMRRSKPATSKSPTRSGPRQQGSPDVLSPPAQLTRGSAEHQSSADDISPLVANLKATPEDSLNGSIQHTSSLRPPSNASQDVEQAHASAGEIPAVHPADNQPAAGSTAAVAAAVSGLPDAESSLQALSTLSKQAHADSAQPQPSTPRRGSKSSQPAASKMSAAKRAAEAVAPATKPPAILRQQSRFPAALEGEDSAPRIRKGDAGSISGNRVQWKLHNDEADVAGPVAEPRSLSTRASMQSKLAPGPRADEPSTPAMPGSVSQQELAISSAGQDAVSTEASADSVQDLGSATSTQHLPDQSAMPAPDSAEAASQMKAALQQVSAAGAASLEATPQQQDHLQQEAPAMQKAAAHGQVGSASSSHPILAEGDVSQVQAPSHAAGSHASAAKGKGSDHLPASGSAQAATSRGDRIRPGVVRTGPKAPASPQAPSPKQPASATPSAPSALSAARPKRPAASTLNQPSAAGTSPTNPAVTAPAASSVPSQKASAATPEKPAAPASSQPPASAASPMQSAVDVPAAPSVSSQKAAAATPEKPAADISSQPPASTASPKKSAVAAPAAPSPPSPNAAAKGPVRRPAASMSTIKKMSLADLKSQMKAAAQRLSGSGDSATMLSQPPQHSAAEGSQESAAETSHEQGAFPASESSDSPAAVTRSRLGPVGLDDQGHDMEEHPDALIKAHDGRTAEAAASLSLLEGDQVSAAQRLEHLQNQLQMLGRRGSGLIAARPKSAASAKPDQLSRRSSVMSLAEAKSMAASLKAPNEELGRQDLRKRMSIAAMNSGTTTGDQKLTDYQALLADASLLQGMRASSAARLSGDHDFSSSWLSGRQTSAPKYALSTPGAPARNWHLTLRQYPDDGEDQRSPVRAKPATRRASMTEAGFSSQPAPISTESS